MLDRSGEADVAVDRLLADIGDIARRRADDADTLNQLITEARDRGVPIKRIADALDLPFPKVYARLSNDQPVID